MRKILETLNSYGKLSQISFEKFEKICRPKNYEKGSFLVKPPQICKNLYFIEDGLLRSYFLKENKEVTISFTSAGEFVAAMGSYIQQIPTYEYLEALDNLKVYEIDRSALEELLLTDLQLAAVHRNLLEQYYVKIEEKLIFSKFKTARERYDEFINLKPHIVQKASVGQIASYLDMSLETLSRIRSKW